VLRRLRRTGSGASAVFADGHGAYLIAMIAFGAAATFLHHALRPERQYRDALARLLSYQHEPFLGETRPMLVGGLLPDASHQDFCKDVELLDGSDRVAEQFAAELAAPAPAVDAMAPCDRLAGCPKPTAGVGPAWSDGATESTLFVPSTVADLVRGDPSTVALMRASRGLEHHRGLLGREFRAGRLTTMYFVSLSGAIRIVPEIDLSDVPAHITFAGAGYTYKSLSRGPLVCPEHGRPRIATRPYLDIVKFGLVRSLCQPIELPGTGTGTGDERVVGTLCFDLAAPEAMINGMLDTGSRLFDLELVRIYKHGGFERCAAIDRCRPSPRPLSADEIEELERQWRLPAAPTPDRGPSGVRLLIDGQYFAARVDHHDRTADRNEYDTVVFGRVQRSPIRDIASAIAMLIFAAIAAAAILRGVRRKARRMDFTLIRGLQVGVVELDAHDRIVGANDRAEEILGMELPSFGSPGEPVLFSSRIIPGQIVLLDDAGLLPDDAVTFCHYDQIDKLRRAGDSSSYYAFTRASRRLIRISGSTFVSAQGQIHTFGTIDTYVDEAHRERVLAAASEVTPISVRSAAGGRR
jgi:PAS domain-containing protein